MRKDILCTMVLCLLITVGCGDKAKDDTRFDGIKIYANNLPIDQLFEGDRYMGGWNSHVKESFIKDNWTFVGETVSTQTFTMQGSYTCFLINWEKSDIKIDSFDDPISGVSFGYDHLGNYVGYYWNTSNFNWLEDTNILGLPNGTYGTTWDGGSEGGFIVFVLYDGPNFDPITNTANTPFVPSKLRITIVK